MRVIQIKLSQASKMPCASFSLPAQDCRTGSKLAKVPGSVCNGCYALKGNYRFPNVKAPRAHNLANLPTDGNWQRWINAMVSSIQATDKNGFFRWHDSGDIQSLRHLESIAAIARALPKISFWLPTKEKGDLLAYVSKHGDFPVNLTVRLSAPMIDGTASTSWHLTSTVHTINAIGTECKAYTRGGKCESCRACWNSSIPNISYPKH